MNPPTAPQTAPPTSPTAASIGNVVRKYWPTAVSTFAAVFVATVFFTLGQTKIYQAEATVMFDPHPPKPLGHRVETVVDLGTDSYWGNQEYYETQYHILKSRRVSLAVVNELGLQNDWAFLRDAPEGAEAPKGAKAVSPENAAEILRHRLDVVPVRDSRLATVMLRDANPERAQRVLSALMDVYVGQNLETALESTTSAGDWLRSQLDSLNQDLQSSEEALHDYKKKNDILSIAFDDKSSMLTDEMKQLNSELTRAKSAADEMAARKAALDSAPTGDPSAIESSELLKSPVLPALRGDYQRAIAERDELLGAGLGEKHAKVQAAERHVADARVAILKEIQNVRRMDRRDQGELGSYVGSLKARLKKAKEQANDLNLLEIEYNRLKRNKENNEKLYSLLLERSKEADLSQMMRINNVSVIDRPLQPGSPVSPRLPLNLAAGLVGGLLLGIAAAFMRGLLDRTIKIPDDLEQELGITFLGLLPEVSQGLYAGAARRRRGQRIENGKAELCVHHDPSSSAAEASRAIRTNLMFMSPDNPHRVLLVTSAGPAEGKTTVACCIAVAMAQAGQKVLLLDCDLRRPRIHRIFDRGSDAGVSTAVLGSEVDDAILPSEVPNLSVLPAGPVPPNPAEMFHTDRFKQVLQQLRGRFDRIIIDSPPIVAVTDPTVLSTLCDGVVLVVRAFKTKKELASHALRSIHDVGAKLIGGVLNAVDFSKLEYKYSYYYYRRDGYYSDRDDKREHRRPSGGGAQDEARAS